ncbi:PP2C family protein-serine/threonine phosphatase [Streptomyces sp. NPDC088190]|uniref:PP2C family protein-serine/threonine phosphatase n=2 Tax=unclassified Streptomyces TaxID=2593676 RepID=UPI002E762839|nr:PP2C family protein-serine/threonine phosphatase [Streptomyces sp. JV190]MEE1838927.1 PP2C family protein-serine/threonine phosphatase [Streptomyces sp. JV190]
MTTLLSHRSHGPAGRVALVLLSVVAITVAGIVTPGYVRVASPLLALPPALAAAMLGPRPTALIGAASLLGEAVIGLFHYDVAAVNWSIQAATVLLVSIIAVYLSHVREAQLQTLTQVRKIAEIAQRLVLQPIPPELGPLRIATLYMAAEQEMEIGGDLYAATRTTSATRLIVGDVRGKGLPAVGDAAQLLGAFRGIAYQEADLVHLANSLDTSVTWHLSSTSDDPHAQESFITAVLADIPDDMRTIRLVQCGHPPPLLLRGGHVDVLTAEQPAPPLGLGLGAHEHHVDAFTLLPGDLLLMHTDGVTEARDFRGTFYPLAERLPRWAGQAPETLLAHLRSDLLAHTGGRLGDDAAMVAVMIP